MKRYLSGLLCILLVLIGTTAIAKVLKGPLVILKAMSAADASTIAVANGMGVYYTDSTNGRAYFVSSAGVAYDLTETGGSSGGAGTTWFYTDGSGVQIVTAGGTQYYRGVSGVSTSGSGATIYFGIDDTVLVTHTELTAGYKTGVSYAATSYYNSGTTLIGHSSGIELDCFLQDMANKGPTMGFAITDGGGLLVSWTSGELYDIASMTNKQILAGSQTCTNNALNYLKWVSGTTLTLNTTAPAGDEVYIGRIDTFNNDIHIIAEGNKNNVIISNLRRGLRSMFPLVVTSGMVVSAYTAAGATVWDVTSSAGTYVEDGHHMITVPAIISAVTPMALIDALGGVTYSDSVDPKWWFSAGVSTAASATKYYKSLFFIGHDRIHWIYPDAEYASQAAAIAGANPTLPAGVQMHPNSIALVLKGNAAAFPTAGTEAWIDVRPRLAGAAASTVQDHGSLSGLDDLDHSGYVPWASFAAAGAPLSTSGASLWSGASVYIVAASGIGGVTQWIAAGTSQYQPASGITPLMVAGTSHFVTKASFATQTDALSTSGASLWSGASTYIINAAATGVSSFTGANLSANQNAVAIAVQFSTSGDSTFVVAPWTFVVSGVSLMNASLGTGVAGASIFLNGSATASYNISGSGSTTYNVTATGRITAGTVLLFSIGTIPTGQTLIEQLFGRKE